LRSREFQQEPPLRQELRAVVFGTPCSKGITWHKAHRPKKENYFCVGVIPWPGITGKKVKK